MLDRGSQGVLVSKPHAPFGLSLNADQCSPRLPRLRSGATGGAKLATGASAA